MRAATSHFGDTTTASPLIVDVAALALDPSVPWFDEMTSTVEDLLAKKELTLRDQLLISKAVIESSTARRGTITCNLLQIEGGPDDSDAQEYVTVTIFDTITARSGFVIRFSILDKLYDGCRGLDSAAARMFRMLNQTYGSVGGASAA